MKRMLLAILEALFVFFHLAKLQVFMIRSQRKALYDVAHPPLSRYTNFSSFTDCVSSHCHDVSNGHTLVLKTQTKPLPMDSNNPKPLYPFAVHPGHWRSPLSLLTTRWEASPKDLGPSPELKSQWLPLNPHSPSPLTALTL